MTPWKVDTDRRRVGRQLKKFKSDRHIMDGFGRAVMDLTESADPAALGQRKHGSLRDCYSYRITRSHRMLYTVDYDLRTVYVLDLGDHKEIYGRDRRA